jgi:hypothetical protein
VQKLKKRKCLNDVDEESCQAALQKLQKEPDNYDRFGQYVALELRSLKSDFNKARMRSEIRKITACIVDEDLYSIIASTFTSILSSALQTDDTEQQI